MTITIITPVYNAAPYLNACLDSILSQSFRDFELLLIDDGSVDASGAICDEYARKDKRIRICHKKNGGVSSARNIGLKMAQGEWILFVDADDTLAPNALQTMVDGISADVAMVMGEYNVCQSDSKPNSFTASPTAKLLSCSQTLQQLLKPLNNHYQGYLWNKLFRADHITNNGIRFNESLYFGEDRLFTVQYLCASKGNVYYTTQPVYNYYLREGSAMESITSGYNPKFATDVESCALAKKCIFNHTHNMKLRYTALWTICESAIRNLYLMKQYGTQDEPLRKEIIQQIKLSGAYPLFLVKYIIKRVLHPEYFTTKKYNVCLHS